MKASLRIPRGYSLENATLNRSREALGFSQDIVWEPVVYDVIQSTPTTLVRFLRLVYKIVYLLFFYFIYLSTHIYIAIEFFDKKKKK